MKKIAIIGGTDGFGKWLANYIKQNFFDKVDITITGRNIEKGKKSAKELSANFSDNNKETIKNSDIIIFAVPIAFMEETIKKFIKFAPKNSVVLDITSVKNGPSKALIENAPDGVLVIPTHPMFGPYVSTIAGQIIVLTPEEKTKNDKRYIFLKNFLNQKNAKVIETSALEHDKMMAVVQGLTHFDIFVFGETVKNLNLDIKKSMDFVSPIYKIMISSVARYLHQNPKLYSDIQIHNKEILEVHEKFMKATNKFNEFVKQKDEENFIKTLESCKNYFGENTKIGQEYTDKIIYLIGQQTEKANKNIGKDIIIKNIYTKEEKKGILEDFKENVLYINSEKFDLNNWEII